MCRNVIVSKLKEDPTAEQPVEIVERKGIGHPDSICDGTVEKFSRYLMEYYYDNFSTPLHHNLDKAVLVGGRAEPKFGGGKVKEPILLHIVGRATNRVKTKNGEEEIPVKRLGKKAVRDYIKEGIRYLDPEEHVKTEFSVRPGSSDLQSLFHQREEASPANDTSVGVGFYPYTTTESACLRIERYLNSLSFKEKFPEVGEDVKVLAVRKHNQIHLTVAAAMISQLIHDIDEYLELKREIREEIKGKVFNIIQDENLNIGSIKVNNADDPDQGNVYLTVTGTSAEAGDDGQVGRGNRPNGLITPFRFMSLEAAAGKNPVSHVGKIYQVAGNELSKKIYQEVKGIKSVYAMLASKIGTSICKPQIVNIKVTPTNEITNDMRRNIEGLTEEYVKNLDSFWKQHLKEDLQVF